MPRPAKIKTTKKRSNANPPRYTYEEYLKHFTSLRKRKKRPSDPAKIGRKIAADALREMQRSLAEK